MALRSIYSTTYVQELEPFFRIDVNDVPLTPDRMKQVEFLKLEEGEGKKGRLEFTIRDPESKDFDTPFIKLQASIVVYAGYVTSFEVRGPFEVVGVEQEFAAAGIKLKVKAEEGGKLANNAARKVYNEGSLRDLFTRIAKDNNLEFSEENTPDLDFELTDEFPIIQGGESTGQFLQTVAAEYGYTLTTTSGKIHLRPADFRASLGVLVLRWHHPEGGLEKVTAKFKKPRVSYVPLTDALQQTFQVEQQLLLPDLDYADALDFTQKRAELEATQLGDEYDALDVIAAQKGDANEIARLKAERLDKVNQLVDRKNLEDSLIRAKLDQKTQQKQEIGKKQAAVQNQVKASAANIEEAEAELERALLRKDYPSSLGSSSTEVELQATYDQKKSDLRKLKSQQDAIESASNNVNREKGSFDRDYNSFAADPNNAQEVFGGGINANDARNDASGNFQGAEKSRQTRTKTVVEERVTLVDGEVVITKIEKQVEETIDIIGIPYDPADRSVGDAAELDEKKIARRKIIREGRLETVDVILQLGAIFIRPQCLVILEGCGKKVGGEHRVTNVLHIFDGRFKTELELKRRKSKREENEGTIDPAELPGGYIIGPDGTVQLDDSMRDPNVPEVFLFPRQPGFFANPGTDELQGSKVIGSVTLKDGLVVGD